MTGFLKRFSTLNLQHPVGTIGRRAFNGFLDQLLPPRCLACGIAVQDTGRLCGACWSALDFLQGAGCLCCGYPFDAAPPQYPGETFCAACQADPPPFDRARMALRYDDGSRGMLLAFKHGDRLDYGPFLAKLLGQAHSHSPGKDARPPLVLPVPLHKNRLRQRRYNQAAVVGQAFAQTWKYDYLADALQRIKHTPPQQGNSLSRKRNVAGAFTFQTARASAVRGRRVILVDDVYTTGATARACARILKRQEALHVEVLAVARVCRPTTL